MAIKGKRKPRKSRGRASIPRPVPATMRAPLAGRRWFQVVLAALVAPLVGWSLGWGMGKTSTTERVEAERRKTIEFAKTYKAGVEAALAKAGSPTQGGFQAYPAIGPVAQELATGKAPPRGSAEVGADTEKGAQDALALMQRVSVPPSNGDIPKPVVDEFIQARDTMAYGLDLYRQAGRELKHAGRSGSREDALAAADLARLAALIVGAGYQQYQTLMISIGLMEPPKPSLPPGIDESDLPPSPPPGFPGA